MPHTYPLLTSITAGETSLCCPGSTQQMLPRPGKTGLASDCRAGTASLKDLIFLAKGKRWKKGETVLVGGWPTPLKICKSVGMMTFPIIIWEHKKCSRPPIMGGKVCEWMWMVCAGRRVFFWKHQICYSTSSGFPVLKTFTLWYAFNTYSSFLKKSWDSETQINPLLPAITIITSASQGQATQGRGEQHLHRLGLWPYQESTHENIEHHKFLWCLLNYWICK